MLAHTPCAREITQKLMENTGGIVLLKAGNYMHENGLTSGLPTALVCLDSAMEVGFRRAKTKSVFGHFCTIPGTYTRIDLQDTDRSSLRSLGVNQRSRASGALEFFSYIVPLRLSLNPVWILPK